MKRTPGKVIDARSELVEKSKLVGVTLNGKPARVVGLACDFAGVVDNETGLSADWSWEAVAVVVNEKGGAFFS